MNPARYAELLKAGYLGVKAGDPRPSSSAARSRPPASTTRTWRSRTPVPGPALPVATTARSATTTTCSARIPTATTTRPTPCGPTTPATAPASFTTHGQFYFRRVEHQRQVMEKYGEGGKQIWLTEFGWCSDYRARRLRRVRPDTPLQDQANYTVRAYPAGAERTTPGWA